MRHRVEAVMSFSGDFVGCLQDNQRFRYNEVMDALNMSAALTARKTKEFRSPPQEQVRGHRITGLDAILLSSSTHILVITNLYDLPSSEEHK